MQKSGGDDLQLLRAQQVQEQQQKRTNLIAQYGSIESYLDSLELCDIVDELDPKLASFYKVYSKVFTLEEEREPLEGFKAVLLLNTRADVQSVYGPFFEQISCLWEPVTGESVGAINQVFYAYSVEAEKQYGFGASCQLNFICVENSLRGIGIAQRLLELLEDKLHAYAAAHGHPRSRVFITCEQNNPHCMSKIQLEEDLRSALIAPQERLDWWYRRGFRKLDFPYIQPPLSADVEACTYLDYYVHMFSGNGTIEKNEFLPAPLLLEHLRRFFFVSVGKFLVDMDNNEEWQIQRDFLSARAEIAIAP